MLEALLANQKRLRSLNAAIESYFKDILQYVFALNYRTRKTEEIWPRQEISLLHSVGSQCLKMNVNCFGRGR